MRGRTTNWIVHVATTGSGEAKAQSLPAAPMPTSSCAAPASSKKVTVTWAAVAHATGYAIYQSNTTANGTYTLQTTVTVLTWTSAALATGNYWYEVVTNIGTNWASAQIGSDHAAHHQQLDLRVRRLARRMVVGAGARRVVEVGIRRPRPLGPIPVGGGQPEHLRHVGQQGGGIASAALGAEVHVVELPDA